MQTIPRWRTLLISRNSIAFSSTQFAYLHSTPICNEKIKRKSDFKGGNQNSRDGNQSFKGAQQSSKNHIRFLTRQKRADTKKALWNLVDKYVVSGTPIRWYQRRRLLVIVSHGTLSRRAFRFIGGTPPGVTGLIPSLQQSLEDRIQDMVTLQEESLWKSKEEHSRSHEELKNSVTTLTAEVKALLAKHNPIPSRSSPLPPPSGNPSHLFLNGGGFENDVPFSKASDSISQNAKNVNSSKTSTKKGRFKNVVCPKSPKKKAHVFRDSYSSTPSKKRNAKKDSAEKINKHRMKRMYQKRHASNDDDEHPETVFHATFGDRAYTWSFNSWTGSSQRSTPRFDWGEFFHRTSDQQQRWQASHESDSENEVCDVGLRSERVILGLPQNGVLKLKDVKNAFHLSALKWHPDKHQGPSQAAAEEKFKLCVSAYNSLCSALSGN
ncbi:unnamed protein product [Amaranthus hypochondriacus]